MKSPFEQVTFQNEIWGQDMAEDIWERTVNSNWKNKPLPVLGIPEMCQSISAAPETVSHCCSTSMQSSPCNYGQCINGLDWISLCKERKLNVVFCVSTVIFFEDPKFSSLSGSNVTDNSILLRIDKIIYTLRIIKSDLAGNYSVMSINCM